MPGINWSPSRLKLGLKLSPPGISFPSCLYKFLILRAAGILACALNHRKPFSLQSWCAELHRLALGGQGMGLPVFVIVQAPSALRHSPTYAMASSFFLRCSHAVAFIYLPAQEPGSFNSSFLCASNSTSPFITRYMLHQSPLFFMQWGTVTRMVWQNRQWIWCQDNFGPFKDGWIILQPKQW